MRQTTGCHVLCGFVIILLAGFIGPAIAQCDGAVQKITKGAGEITSPNRNTGSEYNKSANCSWEFNPPSDGKEYALVITVKRLRLYVLKNVAKHCLGSYNLLIGNEQTNCARYVHGEVTGSFDIPANDFCKSYYRSPACAGVNEIQGCETRQQTSYPIRVRYNSDGRTDPNSTAAVMYFRIRYEFIECPKDSFGTSPVPTSISSTTSPVPTSTIILSVVVAVLVLIIVAGAVFIWKRILAKKPQNANKTGQQESPDGIYDNDPSPSNQENRAYEEITDKSEYETVRSANVEEDPYITPNATPTGGEYEVPIQLAPRQYENVA